VLLGAFAERYGVDITTFVSAVLLVLMVAVLGLWTPRLLRYGGDHTGDHTADDSTQRTTVAP